MASSAFAYRSALIALMKRLWGCFLARENVRLKIARLEHVSGASNRTHAARGQSPARARRRKRLPLPPARRPQQPELVARRLDQGRFSVVDCPTRPRPAVLQNLGRLRLGTVLPNRNGCDSELARLKAHAIVFRKPCARARLARFRVLGIEWRCPPGLGQAVCDDEIVPSITGYLVLIGWPYGSNSWARLWDGRVSGGSTDAASFLFNFYIFILFLFKPARRDRRPCGAVTTTVRGSDVAALRGVTSPDRRASERASRGSARAGWAIFRLAR